VQVLELPPGFDLENLLRLGLEMAMVPVPGMALVMAWKVAQEMALMMVQILAMALARSVVEPLVFIEWEWLQCQIVDFGVVHLEVAEVCWCSLMMAEHVVAPEIAMVVIPWMVLPSAEG